MTDRFLPVPVSVPNDLSDGPTSGQRGPRTFGDELADVERRLEAGEPPLVSGQMHLLLRSPDAVPNEVRAALRDRTVFPAHLFYETPHGAANWASLVQDQGYASAVDSRSLFASRAREIAARIISCSGDRSLSLVGLGPGGASKDEALLRAVAPNAESASYMALDTSRLIAAQALDRILTHVCGTSRSVRASAVVAHFDDLPRLRQLYETGDSKTIVMLLGNTLGNLADERGLLRRIGNATRTGDMLLLEVTLQRPGTDEIASLGDPLTNKAFNFQPLAEIGVQFDPACLGYRMESGKGTIEDTRSVVASYSDFDDGDTHYSEADIAYVHRYEADAVLAAIEAERFSVVDSPIFSPNRRSMVVLATSGGQVTACAA